MPEARVLSHGSTCQKAQGKTPEAYRAQALTALGPGNTARLHGAFSGPAGRCRAPVSTGDIQPRLSAEGDCLATWVHNRLEHQECRRTAHRCKDWVPELSRLGRPH